MMPGNRKCAVCPALVAAFAAVALAVAGPARAEAFGGIPSGASRGAVLPAQMPQQPNVEGNIAMLHQRLGITPSQEPAFGRFADVMRENARTEPGSPPPSTADAPYQLQMQIRAMQQYLGGLRRLLPTLEGLYAVLSPQQRAVANQLFRQGPGQ